MFLKIYLRGWDLATQSLNRYNITQGLLGRICFKSLNIIKKTIPTPTLKK